MKYTKVKPAYQNFFIKSEEGKSYMAELKRQREQAHSEVENNPQRAEYFAGQAKAVSNMINHIEVTCLDK